ncbi:MAG: Fis family transcriptional regulator, partial [Marinilabiliales bacterium]
MDKNDFFREATIRICGNLEIEKALFSTLKFIRNYIPIDFLILEYYDESIKAMRTLAKVTPQSSELLDLVTPVSEKAQDQAKDKYSPRKHKVVYYKDPYEEKLAEELLNFHKIKASSLLIMVLESATQRIGTIAMILTKEEKLHEKQIEYLSLLKEPFAIALSNHRKHREIAHLKELLADDNKYLHQQLRQISGDEIIGANYGLKEVMQQVRQVAILDSPVLILGETGVGKDVIANAIHYSSTRNNNPFITMNC